MYLKFLAGRGVPEHDPQSTPRIEPRDWSLAAAQVNWVNAAVRCPGSRVVLFQTAGKIRKKYAKISWMSRNT